MKNISNYSLSKLEKMFVQGVDIYGSKDSYARPIRKMKGILNQKDNGALWIKEPETPTKARRQVGLMFIQEDGEYKVITSDGCEIIGVTNIDLCISFNDATKVNISAYASDENGDFLVNKKAPSGDS